MFFCKQRVLKLFFAFDKCNILMKDLTYCKFSSIKREANLKNNEQDGNDEGLSLNKKITRLSHSDPSLSTIMLQVKSKKMRKKSNLIYFEGKRLLRDALQAGVVPIYIYFSRANDISSFQFPEETKLFKVPYNDLKLWSDLTTCPGLLAICKKPGIVKDYQPLIPVSVVCDNVREPGNLGSIMRSAAGAGVKNIFLSEGCSDLWDSKVLRGAMGAHFRIPVHNDISWEDLGKSLSEKTLYLIATNEEKGGNLCENPNESVPYYSLSYKNYNDITLVIGGETEGITSHSYSLAKLFKSQKVNIPLCNFVESLNNVSALSVILYEIKRQFQILTSDET